MNYTVKRCDLILNRMEKTENLRYSGDKNTNMGPRIYGKQDIYVEAVYDMKSPSFLVFCNHFGCFDSWCVA